MNEEWAWPQPKKLTEKEKRARQKRRELREKRKEEALSILSKLTKREQLKIIAYFMGTTQSFAKDWLEANKGELK